METVNEIRTEKTEAKNFLKKLTKIREIALIFIIVLFSIVLSIANPVFLTSENILNILLSISITGFLTLGMTVALIAGGFDLSVGSVTALVGIIAGNIFISTENIFLALLVSLLVALVMGSLNGLLITIGGLNPFIATLSIMGIARGLVYIISKGAPMSLMKLPEWLKDIGRGHLFGIPYIVIIFFIAAIIFHILLKYSRQMRKVFYVGSNEDAAYFSGINPNKIKFFVYLMIGFLCWIAGVLAIARFKSASPTFGTGLEMTAISAAVIGGASLSGGEGTVFGSTLGLILLGIVSGALVLLGISVYWQQLISSLVLLIAVLMDSIIERTKANKRI
ncbi:MAG: ABC transporter permease [Spirochaetales bacterium]|uniref:ABC transporter permease n=1 Tax=Candidatus Thalassospirochaeta sargassi TaxID=3119039 RepID=A0AAJ1MI93_9SPIO|nr:ABC transporter permease [Spirochaetales bacterium]